MTQQTHHHRILLPLVVMTLLAALITMTTPSTADAAPVSPSRLFDSRNGRGAMVQPTRPQCIPVAGVNGIPSNAAAVALNITVAGQTRGGFVTAYPRGTSRPNTSTVNFSTGQGAIGNNAIIKVGSSRQVCFYVSSATHLIVDVTGHFTSSQFTGITPFRAGDTRSGVKPGNNQHRCFKVAGTNGVPSNASSVAANITVVQPSRGGFATAFPSGQRIPATSNVNYAQNEVIGNGAVVRVGRYGNICVKTSASAHLIVDVTGYFRGGRGVEALNRPVRAHDSRQSIALRTNGNRCVNVIGNGVPNSAKAVFVNVAVVNPARGGFISLVPAVNGRTPNTSALNYKPGIVRANGQYVPIGSDGKICVFSSASAHFVLDVMGYDTTGSRVSVTPAQRAIDYGMSQIGTIYVGCSASTRLGQVPASSRSWNGSHCGQRTYHQPAGRVGYDCSGLMVAMLAEAGINLPWHWSGGIKGNVPRVDKNNLRPGDMLAKNGHVVMFIGNGLVIESTPHQNLGGGVYAGTRTNSVQGFLNDSSYTAHRMPGL